MMKTFFQIIVLFLIVAVSCKNLQSDKLKKYGDLTDSDYKKDTLRIDSQEVAYRTAVSQNEPQLKIDFKSQDKIWLVNNLKKARQLKDEYWEKPMPPKEELMPRVLDEVFEQWTSDTSKNKRDSAFVVNSLGATLGQYLVDNYNMKWIIVTDSYGTDYAVIHKKWNIIAYPVSSVKKGIEQKKQEFFSSIELLIKQEIKNGDKGNIDTTK